jgi:HlyD family secretion protein
VELDTSRAMLRQTEAQMKEAREQLAKTEIRSPIAGKVTAIFIKAGETAVPSAMSIAGSDLMTVADTGSLYAEVNVDETDVARVGVGQSAKIVPAAFPDKSWAGSVEQVAISPRQSVGQGKSYPVKIRLAAVEDMQFHPGMSCRAEISTHRENADKVVAVPVQAVRYEEAEEKQAKAKASVFVIVDGRAKKRDVETGTADDAYIEISRGLKEQEVIVTGPAKTLRFLRDGERITVSDADTDDGDATAR